MNINGLGLRRAILLATLLIVSNKIIQGQSTVFNTPSTDVVSAQRTYLEADFITHLASHKDGGFQLYGVRAVYGLGKNMEGGLNVYYTRSADSAQPVVAEPNFKWQFYEDEGKGLSAAAGVRISIPVSHRSAGSASGLLYAVGSKKFTGDFSPRLSAGAYLLAVHADQGTSKHGALVGYEQPVNKRLSFIADWTSGRNDLGYLAAGVGITLSPKSALYVGYNVGNVGRGNNSLAICYGRSF